MGAADCRHRSVQEKRMAHEPPTVPLPEIPTVPTAIKRLMELLDDRTRKGRIEWWANPGEASETVEDPAPGGYQSYPKSPLYAEFRDALVVLVLTPGARGGPAITVSVTDSFGTTIESVRVDGIYDFEHLYEQWAATFWAARAQAQVREALEAADVIQDILDELELT